MQAAMTLVLSGELDAADAAAVAAILDELVGTGRTVNVDVAGVTFLDSDIVRALRDARSRSLAPEALRVVNASPLVRRTFEMTGWGVLLAPPGGERPMHGLGAPAAAATAA